jgi:predicted Fe-Mo cluster-binding NifX family protein
MKIAISAVEKSPDGPVDARFGRARYVAVYDDESGTWGAHDNEQNLRAAQGAGVQSGREHGQCGLHDASYRPLRAKGFRRAQ